jgi:dipicolinate synthase subunit B
MIPKNIGFAVTGSFCTHKRIAEEMKKLVQRGYRILPIFSFATANTDTRFGAAADFRKEIADIAGAEPIDTLTGAEPLGPKGLIDLLVVAPCTGNTLSKIANAITDTPVTMAAKAHLRNNKPLVIGISTNDALGFNLANIARLVAAKNVYFVPFGQDDCVGKPKSLISDMSLVEAAMLKAAEGEQLQPILL